jgi:3-hydroxyisobutyrate dehydrogenase-like beta-hydroxyacid dehydrogenase/mannose-6-phosphate isomerase-like protein (cupin superfamily)
MGLRIAQRMLDAGFAVTVWNRHPQRMVALAERGARAAHSPAEAARRADLIITMVFDAAALRAVTEGPDGIAAAVRAPAVVVNMSTVGPEAVHRLADQLPTDVPLLDAPVLGSIEQAEHGELCILLSGRSDVVHSCRPILESLGVVRDLGPLGAAATAKLLVNNVLFGALAVLGEAVGLGRALGLPDETIFAVLGDTPLADQAARRKSVFTAVNPLPRFALRGAEKDAALLLDIANRCGAAAPVARATYGWLAAAAASGTADVVDYTAVLPYIAATLTTPDAHNAAPRTSSVNTAPHDVWGAGCHAWRLATQTDLAVTEELMPPGAAERWHLHEAAWQAFYVLDGCAVLVTPTASVDISAGMLIQVPPGTVHQLRNDSTRPARLLVISAPSTHLDRREMPGKVERQ